MNKIYIILPLVMMALFAVPYMGSVKEQKANAEIRAKEEAEKKKAEDIKKRELEEKARLDAEKRTAQREAEEKEKEEKRKKKHTDAVQKIKDDTKLLADEIQKSKSEVVRLEKQIADMRTRREKEGREALELLKRVELARVQRRNAELEIQRFTEMLAKRADELAVAATPVPPAPKK